MTVDELYKIFLLHRHTGNANDGQKIIYMDATTIKIDDINSFLILVSPNGTKFRLGVDDDGALKTTKM